MESISAAEIISRVQAYLSRLNGQLTAWLAPKLPTLTQDWWNEIVLNNLTPLQRDSVQKKDLHRVEDLDLAEVLRIIDRNWLLITDSYFVNNRERSHIRDMMQVRNRWAHATEQDLPEIDVITDDILLIKSTMEGFGASPSDTSDMDLYLLDLEDYGAAAKTTEPSASREEEEIPGGESEITVGSLVFPTSDPDHKGAVTAIDGNRYSVFIDGRIQSFYREQIRPVQEKQQGKTDLTHIRAALTAYQIYNPGQSNLYSLNSARIDFVPYQFRPALKLMQSDEPKLLIADDVGVGKTIEAGLILKEMEARARDASDNRSNALSVAVICPKPLVTENKWVEEMKRFDEIFENLDGPAFSECISFCETNGYWPENRSKVVIPYSLFNEHTVEGRQGDKKYRRPGLKDLNPKPHFDLLIVDEAHTIRNPNTWWYKGVEQFCVEADAVIFLTATPVQNGDQDLYTLLHLLRPDVVTDEKTFAIMAEPNRAVNRLLRIVRAKKDNWQKEGLRQMSEILTTKWGREVIQHDPNFEDVYQTLQKGNVSRDERVAMISKIEGLHSFNFLISRTRRRDIGDFCIRRTETELSSFTKEQKAIYDKVIEFDSRALALIHGSKNVQFMMTTLLRQAASCIYGLAPFLDSIVEHRLSELIQDADFSEVDNIEGFLGGDAESLEELANDIKQMSRHLPEDDPKIDKLMEVLDRKKNDANPRVIIFSSFHHTLNYIRRKLQAAGYRVGQIDGSVRDEDRRLLRSRFEKETSDPDAIDVMLFSEVGCEGLDYQFCSTMINYDLPWNPMRIEQRIGRIDRRGQKSPYVDIHNMVTEDTIDARIYEKCLAKISVFKSSIGDCGEILGNISSEISEIMFNPNLTKEEQNEKLEQLADNDIRKVQEMRNLENEEKDLYGFDLSKLTIDQDVQDAENYWINADSMCSLVNTYLQDALQEKKNYIQGKQEKKTLRLSWENRQKLYNHTRSQVIDSSNSSGRAWLTYLKSKRGGPILPVTFDNVYANEHRDVMFLTQTHPLVFEAARYESQERNFPCFVAIRVASDGSGLLKGDYEFLIYSWQYRGLRPDAKLVAVSTNETVEKNVLYYLRDADAYDCGESVCEDRLQDLEDLHYEKWKAAKEAYQQTVARECDYRSDRNTLSYNRLLQNAEKQLREAKDEKIRRMREGEIANLKQENKRQKKRIDDIMDSADIMYTELVKGVLHVD